MSINQSYRRLNECELKEVLASEPTVLAKWFGPDDFDAEDGSLDEYLIWHDELEECEFYLNINNTWQALHFLLTNEFCFQGHSQASSPLKNVIMGGTPTDIETTYGVAHYLTPQEVAEVAAALEPLTVETVMSRYDASKFREAKIYPAFEHWKEDDIGEFESEYAQLRAFFLVAAQEGQAMLITSD